MTQTVTDMLRKLNSFREFEDGWYEVYSKATNHELIDFVDEILTFYTSDDIASQWTMGPTGDGGIAFESGGLHEVRVWDVELFYDTRPNVNQWVLSVVEIDDYKKTDPEYNELEFRSRSLLNESFAQFFRQALEKRIFTWE